VLAHESGVRAVTRSTRRRAPGWVETLTRDIAAAAEEYIARIDKLGGALAAIGRGFQQRRYRKAPNRYQRESEAETADGGRPSTSSSRRTGRSPACSGWTPPRLKSRRRGCKM
jgi:hypothetical protein